jgi:dynein regulatory complex protein 1
MNWRKSRNVRNWTEYLFENKETFKSIEAQKAIFQKIIDAKDTIIKTFLDELSKKDDEYGKMIKE